MPEETPISVDLAFDEEVKWYGRRSLKSMIGWILGLLITMIFFGYFFISKSLPIEITAIVGLSIFVSGVVSILRKIFSTDYVITDIRVCSRYGIKARTTNEATLDKIQGTDFKQSLLGRMLNYGTVRVRTAGTAGTEIEFKGVDKPKKLQRKLRDMIERHEEDKEVEERIKRFEDKYMMGEITKEEFEEAKRNLKEKVNKDDEDVTPLTPTSVSDSSISSSPSISHISDDRHEKRSSWESQGNAPKKQQGISQSSQSSKQIPKEKLEELQKMKDKNLISEEEFERKKDEILDTY